MELLNREAEVTFQGISSGGVNCMYYTEKETECDKDGVISFLAEKTFYELAIYFINKGGRDSYNELKPFCEIMRAQGYQLPVLTSLIDQPAKGIIRKLEKLALLELEVFKK